MSVWDEMGDPPPTTSPPFSDNRSMHHTLSVALASSMTKGSCRAKELCTWRMMSELLIARPLSCLVGWQGDCDLDCWASRQSHDQNQQAHTSGGNWLVKDLNSLSVEPISTSPGALSRMESSACVAHALVITCIGADR